MKFLASQRRHAGAKHSFIIMRAQMSYEIIIELGRYYSRIFNEATYEAIIEQRILGYYSFWFILLFNAGIYDETAEAMSPRRRPRSYPIPETA